MNENDLIYMMAHDMATNGLTNTIAYQAALVHLWEVKHRHFEKLTQPKTPEFSSEFTRASHYYGR